MRAAEVEQEVTCGLDRSMRQASPAGSVLGTVSEAGHAACRVVLGRKTPVNPLEKQRL